MAFTQHGSQVYNFGFNDAEAIAIAAAVGLKPQTLSVSYTPEFTAEAKNESGETDAFVKGGKKGTFSMSGFVTDRVLLEAEGLTFDYQGQHFIVTDSKRDMSNTDFEKGELTGVSYPLITE